MSPMAGRVARARARAQWRVHARLRTTPFTPKRRAIAWPAVWLSLQNPGPVPRGRSQLASDTCHQVSPRAVPSSERQEQSSRRLRTASIARVSSLSRHHVRPPCREHPSTIARDRSAKSPSMRPLINQRAPSTDQWQSTEAENLLNNNNQKQPTDGSDLANAAGNKSAAPQPDRF